MQLTKVFVRGLWRDNAIFRLVLGLCPTLAVTTSARNGLGMGLATTFVLLCSNVAVSALRGLIPAKVRIPAFVVVIATFVTVAQLFLEAYAFDLYQALGIFIPLIVVNCLILGRAEACVQAAVAGGGRRRRRHGARFHPGPGAARLRAGTVRSRDAVRSEGVRRGVSAHVAAVAAARGVSRPGVSAGRVQRLAGPPIIIPTLIRPAMPAGGACAGWRRTARGPASHIF